MSLATDPTNGPLVGLRTTTGKSLVKKNSLSAGWVEESASSNAFSVATSALSGPFLGLLSSENHALVKRGTLYGEWTDLFGGISSVSIAG